MSQHHHRLYLILHHKSNYVHDLILNIQLNKLLLLIARENVIIYPKVMLRTAMKQWLTVRINRSLRHRQVQRT